mmetsp:Transcript_26345/g.30467  ORF Transcript_26345/g.30467 Transcript_26345/m.30467 type:complete len:106 (+) Transcript_26345:291-608(+)
MCSSLRSWWKNSKCTRRSHRAGTTFRTKRRVRRTAGVLKLLRKYHLLLKHRNLKRELNCIRMKARVQKKMKVMSLATMRDLNKKSLKMKINNIMKNQKMNKMSRT